ncbi:ComGF family competence protein [Bacillaceae bacterium Marseille-Q3522]|nr:ComGF family competence protein [Bacillaceae bacterium Marseille-Q3522]
MKIFHKKRESFVTFGDEKAFTLLEVCYALSIFCLFAAVLPLTFRILYQDDIMAKHLQKMEWNVFSGQLKKEVRLCSTLSVDHKRLTLINEDGSIVTYEKYQDKVRRKVNGTGHEIALQNINSLEFTAFHGGIQITVTDHYQQNFESKIWSYIAD